MKRRQFVATAGAVATVGVAGCTGSNGSGDFEYDGETPESASESWIRFSVEDAPTLDLSEIENRALSMLHTDSFLVPVFDGFEDEDEDEIDEIETDETVELQNLEIDVVDEDLNEEEIEEWNVLVAWRLDDRGAMDAITERNAAVVATYDAVNGGTESNETRILLAPEDDEWRILG